VARKPSWGAELSAFPDLNPMDAVMLRKAKTFFDSTSAVPSITGAGMATFGFVFSRTEQTAPTNLLETQNILGGIIHVGGYIAANYLLYSERDAITEIDFAGREAFENEPCPGGVWVVSQTNNITNAATTVMGVRFLYDIVTLTVAEMAALQY